MNHRIIFICLLLSFLFSACNEDELEIKTASCTASISAYPQLDEILAKYVNMGIPGVSMIYYDGEQTYQLSKGKASIENNIEMMPCHLFHSASMAKTFFAALAHKLQDVGLVDLKSNIKNILPQKHLDKLPNFENISINQLLDHTSGLPDFYTNEHIVDYIDDLQQVYTIDEMLYFLKGSQMDFEPGTNVNYSNTNYLLLALILDELVEGKDHIHLFYEYLVEPLDLSDTYYDIGNNIPESSRMVDCYFDYYGDGKLQNCSPYEFNFAAMNIGHDGIVATSQDYFKFLFSLMEGEYLSESSMDNMLTFEQYPVDLLVHLSEGRGVRKASKNEIERIGHFGATLGAANGMFYYPDQNKYLVVCCNFGRYLNSPLTDIYASYYEELEATNTLIGDLEHFILQH